MCVRAHVQNEKTVIDLCSRKFSLVMEWREVTWKQRNQCGSSGD